MAKAIFKSYNQSQGCLFPMRLEDKIPANAPVRLVSQIVDKLDICNVIDTCSGGGTSSCHPRMMLKLVLYAYLNNIYSCRKDEGISYYPAIVLSNNAFIIHLKPIIVLILFLSDNKAFVAIIHSILLIIDFLKLF
jgi:hypothetical protein